MQWLNTSFSKVTQYLHKQIEESWPDLIPFLDVMDGANLGPETIIPFSACKATGSNPENTLELAAALISFFQSVRILDDLQDRDIPTGLYATVGPARAFNYAYAFMTLGHKILSELPCDEQTRKDIHQIYMEGAMITLAGQDRDLQGMNKTWEDYWKTAEMKTCYMTSTQAAMGARMGTDDLDLIQACRVYGFHWGFTLQILNDLEGIWEPEGKSDLEQGKITLPVLYGTHCQHPEQKELQMIVWQGKIAEKARRVKEILDNIDTKSYLIWAALEQRRKALEAIQICPDEEGKNALTYFLNGMFGDIDELLERPISPPQRMEIPVDFNAPLVFRPKTSVVTNRSTSVALDIRRTLRNTNN